MLHNFFVDINECEEDMDHCDENADCYDVTGSYGCSCHSGFRGDGFNCTGKYKIVKIKGKY